MGLCQKSDVPIFTFSSAGNLIFFLYKQALKTPLSISSSNNKFCKMMSHVQVLHNIANSTAWLLFVKWAFILVSYLDVIFLCFGKIIHALIRQSERKEVWRVMHTKVPKCIFCLSVHNQQNSACTPHKND